ncbi:hypothetical protein RHMOL_Rhmol04G0235200 [Rhododendron molle]|uniref:Uncharacterized protein n=1 Tax=Rhododendron molle TaxID=49168 RepID=A0ACC0P3U4_RHOML|nr:hypothetical protein RHMOL_Rhmol04G0235200 [Rhododendron molle]
MGYVPLTKGAKKRKGTGKPRTLQGNKDNYFVRERGGTAYMGQVEPFWDPKTRTWLPSFEVFVADTWSDSEDEELAREEFKKQLVHIKGKINWLKTFD